MFILICSSANLLLNCTDNFNALSNLQLPKVLTWEYTTAFRWYDCQWPWTYFKVIGLFHIKFLKNGAWYGKSYYRQLIGNHTLAFDWFHFWWPWSTFEGHFSLGCHFHVHFSYPWHAFVSHGLPAIAEILLIIALSTANKIFMIFRWRALQFQEICNKKSIVGSPNSLSILNYKIWSRLVEFLHVYPYMFVSKLALEFITGLYAL